jgi:hypothetical protein
MQSEIRIQNGGFHLTASGIFITASNQPLTFTIIDNGQPLDIIMKFENDESNPKDIRRKVNGVPDKNSFEIIFTNHNSVLGTFTKEPWLIGNAYNRKLYLLYIISGFNETPLKQFQYSLYLGEEVTNG